MHNILKRRDLSYAPVGRTTLSSQGHGEDCEGTDAFRWLLPGPRVVKVDARIKVD